MPSLNDAVTEISATLSRLKPGPLAELRRMKPDGPGTPDFWRLAAELDLHQGRIDAWMRIVRIMAILTDKGAPETRIPLHDPKRPLGRVLADGGDIEWRPPPGEKDPSPVLSEARFARFVALTPDRRGEALERIARALARTRRPGHGVNCRDIAALLIDGDSPDHVRKLARDFYNRLDGAKRQDENGQDEGTA